RATAARSAQPGHHRSSRFDLGVFRLVRLVRNLDVLCQCRNVRRYVIDLGGVRLRLGEYESHAENELNRPQLLARLGRPERAAVLGDGVEQQLSRSVTSSPPFQTVSTAT